MMCLYVCRWALVPAIIISKGLNACSCQVHNTWVLARCWFAVFNRAFMVVQIPVLDGQALQSTLGMDAGPRVGVVRDFEHAISTSPV